MIRVVKNCRQPQEPLSKGGPKKFNSPNCGKKGRFLYPPKTEPNPVAKNWGPSKLALLTRISGKGKGAPASWIAFRETWGSRCPKLQAPTLPSTPSRTQQTSSPTAPACSWLNSPLYLPPLQRSYWGPSANKAPLTTSPLAAGWPSWPLTPFGTNTWESHVQLPGPSFAAGSAFHAGVSGRGPGTLLSPIIAWVAQPFPNRASQPDRGLPLLQAQDPCLRPRFPCSVATTLVTCNLFCLGLVFLALIGTMPPGSPVDSHRRRKGNLIRETGRRHPLTIVSNMPVVFAKVAQAETGTNALHICIVAHVQLWCLGRSASPCRRLQ